jgi:putative transposase
MSRSKHSEAQMIEALKQVEAGRSAEEVGRAYGVSKRLREQFGLSQRHACELMKIPRSTERYASRKDDRALREKLVALALEQPRYGYRRLCVLLKRDGLWVNAKRVRRVYRAAGFEVRRIWRRRLIRGTAPRPVLTGPNQEWALDFAQDATGSGRRFRALSVIDAYTRQCLALETDTSFPSRRVTRVLEAAMTRYGRPATVRSLFLMEGDTGPLIAPKRDPTPI